ncbi:peptidase inhibitor family I36 protein [Streptomyces sp. NPDC093801]|uniref:peptidase inhibitor family I36 protein n=1 Tax=Streptomyces sp. NPDC093801 TaxID=3155203 RepID=UPI00344CD3BD
MMMTSRRKTARLAVSAAAVAGLVMTAATSASASVLIGIGQGAGACPAAHVCLWSENDFVGATSGSRFGAIASNQNVGDLGKLKRDGALWTGMQDVASSVVNNTGSGICFYEHNNYGGLQFRIGPWEKWPSVPSWINDRISSFTYC